jgi:anti-sigma B factor antagonist
MCDQDTSIAATCAMERREPATLLIRLDGELDAVSAPVLEEQIDPTLVEGCGDLLLDLQGVTFIDSVGIRLLVSVLRKKRPETPAALIRPRACGAHRALTVVGLDRVVVMRDG